MAPASDATDLTNFPHCDVEDVIGNAPLKSCWDYSDIYYQAARAAERNGDDCSRTFDLLSRITALELQFEVKGEPFGPVAILDGLDEAHVTTLAERATRVRDPELRARLRDLAWVKLRDHQSARAAVEDYLASVATLADAGVWLLAARRIERALRLGAELRDETSQARVVTQIENMLSKYRGDHEAKFLAAELMELLLEHRTGDADRHADLAEEIAEHAESEADWLRAEKYWQLKAQWDERRGDLGAARSARLQAAETRAALAEEALIQKTPNYALASFEYLRAVEAFRQLGERERAEELRQQALGIQEQALSQTQSISIEFDFSKYADSASVAVAGKSLREALLSLSTMGKFPTVEWLRLQTEEQIQSAPLQHLIAAFQHDHRGRVIARRPAHGSNDADQEAKAMEASMLANAEFFRHWHTLAVLEPARRRILLEHRPRVRDFLDLVHDSPFVPEGREPILAAGLYAELVGDFMIAGHLLPPQIENSVRHLLERRGVLTSSLSSDGIQEDLDLNALLDERRRADVEALFGEDPTFDLRGLLVERWGANLRNRMAHGLMDYDAFSTTQVVYLWWLTLRLCCWPLIRGATASGQTAQPRSRLGIVTTIP